MELAVQYRCYFLNLRSAIAGVEIIEADTDSDAVARADTLFREKGAGLSGVGVWDRGRRVERQLDDGSVAPAEQIRRWRMKAEEIRTAADGFADGSARQHMRNSAETYEALANTAEARFQRRKDRGQKTRLAPASGRLTSPRHQQKFALPPNWRNRNWTRTKRSRIESPPSKPASVASTLKRWNAP